MLSRLSSMLMLQERWSRGRLANNRKLKLQQQLIKLYEAYPTDITHAFGQPIPVQHQFIFESVGKGAAGANMRRRP